MKHIQLVAFDLSDTLLRQTMSGLMLTDGVAATLEALYGQAALAVATNSPHPADDVRRVLTAYDIDRYFAHIFTSADIGVTKPHMAYFSHIVAVTGIPARACVMIGDSYHIDIVGAKSAGWQTIWLYEGGGEAEAADQIIASVAAVTDALAALDAGADR